MERINYGDNFNTRSVTKMNNMFQGCKSFETISFGDNFDTSKVTTMQEMFNSCNSLKSINLSSFNTTALLTTESMFLYCRNLESVEQHFTFENLENSNSMFSSCEKLKEIDLSGVIAKKLSRASYMFGGCNSLTSINIKNLIAGKISDTDKIFSDLPDKGNLTYNSLKLNRKFLVTLPSGWTKTDVKYSS